MVGPAIPGRCGRRLRCGAPAAFVSLPLLVDLARRTSAPRIALALAAESVGLLLGGGQAAHAQTLEARVGPSAGAVTLVWDNPKNGAITWYQYRQKAGSAPYGAWTDISNSDKNTVKHTVTGLTNGTTYTFQVRADLKFTTGNASGDVTATPLPPAAAPTGLAAAVTSANSNLRRAITLRWDNPGNPAITKWEYRLIQNSTRRRIGSWTTISQVATTTSYRIGREVYLNTRVTYTIQVRARIGTVSGEWSAVRARLSRSPKESGRAPTVAKAIPDQTATAGAAFSYTFPAGTFTDPDSSTLTYRATKQDDTALPAWLSFNAGKRTFSGTPGATDAGSLTVKVAASDGYNEASDIFCRYTIV